MALYSHKTWKCPFFTWDEREKIHCEGGVLKFEDKESLDEYAESFCACDNWGKCSIAQNRLNWYEKR